MVRHVRWRSEVLGSVYLTNTALAVTRGFGRHIWSGPPDVLKSWAISVFIAELSYTATMVFVKLSILAFYWRSFGIKKSIKIPIILLAAMTVIWGIGVVSAPTQLITYSHTISASEMRNYSFDATKDGVVMSMMS